MSMTLYQINNAITECIDSETGEVIDFDRLSQLVMDREAKIDGIACWFKELTAEYIAIDSEISALEARKKTKKNKAESLKCYLSDILGGAKFETARNKITWRESDEVCILDADKIPSEYKTNRIEITISKVEIKKAIKSGIIVDGADLLYKNNIQIK